MTNQPLALSVEQVRHEMLRGILIPRDIVNHAIRRTVEKLDAKETKFFSFRGKVVEKHEVEDHGVQLQAADTIFSLAGLYARDGEKRVAAPSFELSVDISTGIIRLSTGSPATSGELPMASSAGAPELVESTIIEHAPQAPAPIELPATRGRISYDEFD